MGFGHFCVESLEISKGLHGAVTLFEIRRTNIRIFFDLIMMLLIELKWQKTLTEHLLYVFFGTDFLSHFPLEDLFDILLFEVVLDALLIVLFALVFLDSLGDNVLEGFDGLHSLSKHGLDV